MWSISDFLFHVEIMDPVALSAWSPAFMEHWFGFLKTKNFFYHLHFFPSHFPRNIWTLDFKVKSGKADELSSAFLFKGRGIISLCTIRLLLLMDKISSKEIAAGKQSSLNTSMSDSSNPALGPGHRNTWKSKLWKYFCE